MRSTAIRWLSRPKAPFAIAALGLLLLSPALGSGLTADDYYHELVLTSRDEIAWVPHDPLSIFVWANGDPARARAMMEVGVTGWWTDPELVMAYFRPLTVATHWLDYRLWPDSPWLMHLQSLLWFGLALLLLGRLYARVFAAQAAPAYLAPLALLLFAVDDAHGFTVAWVANRNALCAFVLALCALLLYDRAVREGDRRAARAAPIVLLLALLAGESALATTGYLLAYALFIDPAPRRQALRRLLPCAAAAAAWALCYRALGFGARGSGLVVDPGSEPVRYALKALTRVPVLLAAELAIPPADLWEAYPMLAAWLPKVMLGAILLLLALLLRALVPVLRAQPSARFFALGCLLSALPVAAQFPSDRLLLFLGLGGAPLIALLIDPLLAPERTRRPRLAQRAIGYGCVALHLVLAPLWLPLRARAPLDAERMIDAADRSLDESPAVRDKTLVLINPPVDAFAGYLPTRRAAQQRPLPRAVRWLATGGSPLTIERTSIDSLRVRPRDGFLSLSSERMQRDPERRMPVGHLIRFSDLTIEITALTADGRPAEILAHFDRPLEDPSYRFMYWHGRRYAPFALPKVGAVRELPRVDFASLLP